MELISQVPRTVETTILMRTSRLNWTKGLPLKFHCRSCKLRNLMAAVCSCLRRIMNQARTTSQPKRVIWDQTRDTFLAHLFCWLISWFLIIKQTRLGSVISWREMVLLFLEITRQLQFIKKLEETISQEMTSNNKITMIQVIRPLTTLSKPRTTPIKQQTSQITKLHQIMRQHNTWAHTSTIRQHPSQITIKTTKRIQSTSTPAWFTFLLSC